MVRKSFDNIISLITMDDVNRNPALDAMLRLGLLNIYINVNGHYGSVVRLITRRETDEDVLDELVRFSDNISQQIKGMIVYAYLAYGKAPESYTIYSDESRGTLFLERGLSTFGKERLSFIACTPEEIFTDYNFPYANFSTEEGLVNAIIGNGWISDDNITREDIEEVVTLMMEPASDYIDNFWNWNNHRFDGIHETEIMQQVFKLKAFKVINYVLSTIPPNRCRKSKIYNITRRLSDINLR